MSATLIQVASPSREEVNAYDEIRREMESLCGEINGNYGDLDWMPIRYLHRIVARRRLPGLYKGAKVGLVRSDIGRIGLLRAVRRGDRQDEGGRRSDKRARQDDDRRAAAIRPPRRCLGVVVL